MDKSVCNNSDSDSEIMGVENIACSIEKTNSLPVNARMEFWDEDISSALRINPEDIASQLTLLDYPMFDAIQQNELECCAWTKKNKLTIAPNVVAFSKRFNQISYWTIDEILRVETAKGRAEVVSHFIKVSKRLLEHNNLHSLFAVVSALQSASIFRLIKTWSCLSKKDKHGFDKLADLFSDKDNWANLREYLVNVKLPCIPYLGIFLTDLVYVDNLTSDENRCKSDKFKHTLNFVMKFKSSDYSHISPLPSVQEYLQRIRFIEELQKFQEDNHYKLSLKYEPNKATASSSNSKESIRGSESVSSESSSSSRRLSLGTLIPTKHFSLGHRKSRSLGAKFRSTSLPRNFLKIIGSIGFINQPCTSSGVNLLDDSVLENSPPSSSCVVPRRKSFGPGNHSYVPIDSTDNFQGPLKRKCLLKCGTKPSISAWQRYWVVLWKNTLVFYAPRSFTNFSSSSTRSDYKKESVKMVPLDGWEVSLEKGVMSEVFTLIHENTGNVYSFKCESITSSQQWVGEINKAKSITQQEASANLMSFD